MKALFTVVLLLLCLPLQAEQPPQPPSVPAAPVPGQVMPPGVTIIQTDNETIYEYRAGSHLYMVRVVPKSGAPYYFFDRNGDGELDIDKDDPHSSVVNQWILFRW